MEDETDHQSYGNGFNPESPESPYAKTKTCNNYDALQTHNNKEQDRFLPIANVGRIMKKVIPGTGKISKDAKETVQECVSEFISFVTGEASDRCQSEKRKTINGEDILYAITTLGFEDYVIPLQVYLKKYREIEGEKLNVPKQQRSSLSSQQHEQQQHHGQQIQEQENKSSICYNTVYSVPQTSFMQTDQPYSMPNFSTNSMQKQLQAQDQIDSVVHW